MTKSNISTYVFLGLCINIFLLIFLPEIENWLITTIKVTIIIGLIWFSIYYFEKISNGINTKNENIQSFDIEKIDNLSKIQFSELLNITSAAIKTINENFQVGFYIYDDKTKSYVLNNSLSKEFNQNLNNENEILRKLISDSNNDILYQKDNLDIWNTIFNQRDWRGSECAIIKPLSFNGKNSGFILVKSDHFSTIDSNSQNIINQLSKIISLFLEDLDLLDKTMANSQQKMQIFNLLTEINLNHSESEILNKFRNLLNYLFDYDCLTISKFDKFSNTALIKLVDGVKINLPNKNSFNINGTINGLPYINQAVVNSSNSSYNLYRFSSDELSTIENNYFIGAPIIQEGKLWGAIMMERFDEKGFVNNDEELLLFIIQSLQSSLLWHTEYQNIYEDAIKDGLTGLLNHKTFVDRAREEIERARRFQHHLVFLIYDLDKFKRINDTLGHPYGDYVIKTTAKIIKDNVRSIDLVARYGGEEFAVVLVNTTTEGAFTVAQRIVDNIAEHKFLMDDKKVKMTISCGLSEYPNNSDKLSDLIQFADEGLYKTKDSGGNAVTVYEQQI